MQGRLLGVSPAQLISAALAALALLAAGCGSGSDGSTTTSTSTKTVTLRTKESADPLPKLDRGWVVVRSRSGGFVLGRPPGWEPERSGSSLTLLAPDRLVAVTVSADRSPSGLAIAPSDFAVRTAKSLAGYDGKLSPSKSRSFDHRYDGKQVVLRTRSKDGVPQEVRVIALRRERLVTYTAVIARNAKRPDAQEAKQALEIVGSIRSRPNNGGAGNAGAKKDKAEKKG
ncbi:hypothetical protein BH10ACT11_BH10ACT11_03140 [soil metagenome]